MGNRVIWVQFNRALKFPVRLREIELVKPGRYCQSRMRFGQSIIKLKSLLCRRYGFWIGILWTARCVARQKCIRISESSVGECVIRVCRDGLLKVIDRLPQIVTSPLVPKISSLQIKLVRFAALSRSRRNDMLFGADRKSVV